MIKNLINIKRFYCGGKNKKDNKQLSNGVNSELVTTRQLPIIDELVTKNNGIFSDVKHKENLLAFWKNNTKKSATSQIIKQHPILQEQENIQEEKTQQEQEVQKQLPKLAQLVIKTGIESVLEKRNTNEKKQEQEQDHKNFMIETAIKIAQGVYNAQGWPALVIGLVQVLVHTPNITKNLSVNKGLVDWGRFLIKNPWNKVMNFFRLHKYKISSGSLGTGAGLDMVKELNVQGADVIFANGKHYIVNQNVKEHIGQQVVLLEKDGVQVTDLIIENMVIQGKGVVLSKNTLEPMIKNMPWDKQDEIMELNIFSSDVATNLYNFNNVPSILSNPIDAIKNINDYTNTILNAAGGNDNFSVISMLFVAAITIGVVFLGVRMWKNMQQPNLNGEIFIPINNNNDGFDFIKVINTYKNNIFYGALGLLGLGGFFSLKNKEKKKEEDDSDLC